MNIPTITMEPERAKEEFEAYRAAVKERHNAEDEAIMRGYKELAAGRQVLNLHDVMRSVGVDEKNQPKLAICRSDAKWCFYDRYNEQPTFCVNDWWYRTMARTKYVQLPRQMFPALIGKTWGQKLQAMVPPIPPGLRPKFNLANYHTLWEAEWQRVPPVDPMLLKHLGGALYAVLAAWDLTELERSVLAGRFTEPG